MALQLDQSQTTKSWGGGAYQGYGIYHRAQTFTAGLTGTLDKIIIWLYKWGTPPNNLIVEIRTTSANKPTSTVLASKELTPAQVNSDSETEILFSSPASITATIKYAIVIYQKSDGGDYNNKYLWYGNASGGYANGDLCDTTIGEPNWSIQSQDEYFKTYVNSPETIQENIYSNAKIHVDGIQKTIYSDANIVNRETIKSDAHIKVTEIKSTINSDAKIHVDNIQETISSDAIISSIVSSTIKSDAYIKIINNQETIDSDATITARIPVDILSDATIQSVNIKNNILSDAKIAIEILENIANDFRYKKVITIDVKNVFKTKKEEIPNISNKFKMLTPSQQSHLIKNIPLGKTYFSVFINGIDVTNSKNIDIDSLSWRESLNGAAETEFDFALPYDSALKPIKGHSVEIKFNGKRKFYGNITLITQSSNPEKISIRAEDKFYQINQESCNFTMGRKPEEITEVISDIYYLTYKEALGILGFNADLGNFTPPNENYSEALVGDTISQILGKCGNFKWFIKPDGNYTLWEGDRGSIIDLEEQKIGTNLNIYQALDINIKEDDTDKVDKLKVVMGDDVRPGYDNTFFGAWRIEYTIMKAPDDPDDYASRYISSIEYIDTRTNLSSEKSRTTVYDGWTITVPPGYLPGFPTPIKGTIYPIITWAIANKDVEDNIVHYHTFYQGGFYPEGTRSYILYIGSGTKTRTITLSNLNRQYGCSYSKIIAIPADISTVFNYTWSNFYNQWVHPSLPQYSSCVFKEYTCIPSWDDTTFALDIANEEYQKYKDCADFYDINLAKRITINGLLNPVNITSIDYNVGNYIATINFESQIYYKRTVSYPIHPLPTSRLGNQFINRIVYTD
jgi:hypothetical protein